MVCLLQNSFYNCLFYTGIPVYWHGSSKLHIKNKCLTFQSTSDKYLMMMVFERLLSQHSFWMPFSKPSLLKEASFLRGGGGHCMTSQRTVAKKTMQIANHDNKKKLGRREKRECKTFIIGIFLSSPLPLLTYLKWYVSLTDQQIGSLGAYPIKKQAECMPSPPSNCTVCYYWLTDYLGSLTVCRVYDLAGWLTNWLSGLLTQWLNELGSEWMSE